MIDRASLKLPGLRLPYNTSCMWARRSAPVIWPQYSLTYVIGNSCTDTGAGASHQTLLAYDGLRGKGWSLYLDTLTILKQRIPLSNVSALLVLSRCVCTYIREEEEFAMCGVDDSCIQRITQNHNIIKYDMGSVLVSS